ncbi:MAG: hypothetical protein ACOYUZ_06380 [Patescibacteria group bacterium]
MMVDPSATFRESIYCNCDAKHPIHHPECCFRCRHCGRKVKHQYIAEHEATCRGQLVINQDDVKKEA